MRYLAFTTSADMDMDDGRSAIDRTITIEQQVR
jgi:hypothetical protein